MKKDFKKTPTHYNSQFNPSGSYKITEQARLTLILDQEEKEKKRI